MPDLVLLALFLLAAVAFVGFGPEARRLRQERRDEAARVRAIRAANRADAEALARWQRTRGRLRMAGHDPDLAGPPHLP